MSSRPVLPTRPPWPTRQQADDVCGWDGPCSPPPAIWSRLGLYVPQTDVVSPIFICNYIYNTSYMGAHTRMPTVG